jgi:hypothetical protein
LVIFAIKSGDFSNDKPMSMTWAYVLLLLLSVLELFYFLVLKGGTWFCSPDQVGWILTVVNFILYAALIALQYTVFNVMSNIITHRSIMGSYKIGIISAAVGIGLLLVQSHFYKGNNTLYIIALVILFGGQVVQLVVNILHYGVFFSLAISIIYLICFTALLVLFANFLQLLFIAFLAYCFIAALADNSKSPSRSSTSSNDGNGNGGSNWGWAKNCRHFRETGMMCHLGYAHECGLLKSGRCQHGQM